MVSAWATTALGDQAAAVDVGAAADRSDEGVTGAGVGTGPGAAAESGADGGDAAIVTGAVEAVWSGPTGAAALSGAFGARVTGAGALTVG